MRVRYRKQQDLGYPVQQVVEREARKLDNRLAHVSDDLKTLNVSIEQHIRDGSHTASLRLSLPGHEIAALGIGPRQDTAVRDAFGDLDVRVNRYLARQRHDGAKRREGKFHRDKAALVEDVIEAGQGWPAEPPRTPAEAAEWGKVNPAT